MKKLLLLAAVAVGLAAINARIDETKQCSCQPECWCQKHGLRHFRWVLPIGHKDVPAHWKRGMEPSYLAFIAVTTGLVASCSASGDVECQPASAAYRELFRNESITRAPVESDILVMDSAVRDAWYIVAKVDESIPVWVTDRDPEGEEVGRIITANRAAQRLSSADFVDMPLSRSESAQAAGDPDRIAFVESCISG